MNKTVETRTTLTEGSMSLVIEETRSGTQIEVVARGSRAAAANMRIDSNEAHMLWRLLEERYGAKPAEPMKGPA